MLPLALLASGLFPSAHAPDVIDAPALDPYAEAKSKSWSFDFAPYYWAASLSGDITVDGQQVGVDDGGDGFFGDPALLGYLGHFEAHHGPWSFVFAPLFITADMQGGQPPATDADLSIHAQVHELFVAREFAEGWEWMLGARYQRLETDMDLSVGGVFQSSHDSTHSWTDPIVGLRYHTQFDENWSLHARADIGGFGVGSDFVWNASVIGHYQFTELFGMYLGYRALDYDFEDRGGSGRLAYDLAMYGPIIGISFTL